MIFKPVLTVGLPLIFGAHAAAQVAWTKLDPAKSPSPRSSHVMVYDAARDRVVLFGGFDAGQRTALAETWEFDGTTWSKRSPSVAPPARWEHTMVYDAARRRVVLFGGWTGSADLGGTWEYDGANWRRVSSGGPSARRGHAMAYDQARKRTVLFGGASGPANRPTALADTWEFDGKAWQRRAPTASPAARWHHGMAFDGPTGNVLLHGGHSVRNDAWEWDGNNWRHRPTRILAPLENHALAFATAHGRVVMFGGWNHGGPSNATYEWTGLDWELRSPTGVPAPRIDHGLAYDSRRDRVVLFGGWDRPGYHGDTWVYAWRPMATFTPFGAGCRSSAGVPTLSTAGGTLPWLGHTLSVRLTGLPSSPLNVPLLFIGGSRTSWRSTKLPFDLGAIGMPGCSLLVSPDQSAPSSNRAGTATWSLPIPKQAFLLGSRFYLQGIVIDRAANALGAAVSNGGEAVIGAR